MRKSVPHTAKGNMTGDTDLTIKRLMMTLSSDNDSGRKDARQSLVAIGRSAVPPLIEALKQKDDHVRRESVKALCEIGGPEVAPALLRTLEDEEFDIRWLAAEELIGLGMNGLKALLQALIDHGDSPLLRRGTPCDPLHGKGWAEKIFGSSLKFIGGRRAFSESTHCSLSRPGNDEGGKDHLIPHSKFLAPPA